MTPSKRSIYYQVDRGCVSMNNYANFRWQNVTLVINQAFTTIIASFLVYIRYIFPKYDNGKSKHMQICQRFPSRLMLRPHTFPLI